MKMPTELPARRPGNGQTSRPSICLAPFRLPTPRDQRGPIHGPGGASALPLAAPVALQPLTGRDGPPTRCSRRRLRGWHIGANSSEVLIRHSTPHPRVEIPGSSGPWSPRRERLSRRRTRDPHQSFQKVLDAIYEAATDPALWPGFLEQFNDATDSSVTTLHLHDLNSSVVDPFGGAVGCDEQLQREYIEYYASRNVYMERCPPLMRTGFVGVGAQAMPLSEVKRTEYFNGWLRRVGALDAMSACLFREDNVLAKLDFLRPIDAPGYGPTDVAFTTRLLPHLQRALAIHRRLRSAELQRSGAERTLDGLAFGICLLDGRGRSTFVNRAARALLATEDGLALDQEGRLVASDRSKPAASPRRGRVCHGGTARHRPWRWLARSASLRATALHGADHSVAAARDQPTTEDPCRCRIHLRLRATDRRRDAALRALRPHPSGGEGHQAADRGSQGRRHHATPRGFDGDRPDARETSTREDRRSWEVRLDPDRDGWTGSAAAPRQDGRLNELCRM